MAPALQIHDLSTEIELTSSVVHAVGNVDLEIAPGETLGLVGESGCGKSMLGLSILNLLPAGGRIVEGSIKLGDTELVGMREPELQRIRGNRVAMIFQDSQSSLNPTKTIGAQVAEPVRLHRGASRKEAAQRALGLLELVGMPQPRERLGDYPHRLSGGLRQRVMIAIALACEPEVLIADEPTTALDVTIQAQILSVLDGLKSRLGMATLLVTHDMGVLAGRADRVNVMYAGRIVEQAETHELFGQMRHPYTQALLSSIPRLDQDNRRALATVPGLPPDLAKVPPGCRFAPRCPRASEKCTAQEPPLDGADARHQFACWHPVDGPISPATTLPAPRKPVIEVSAPASGAPATREPEAASEVAATGEPEAASEAAATGEPQAQGEHLLEILDAVREYPVTAGVLQRRVSSVKAVSGITLRLRAGEILGLVGESGCGKTTLGKLIVGIEKPDRGSIRLTGEEIFRRRGRARRSGGRALRLLFQDPYAALDPRMG
ncbi:MAG: ABC transporter ATP-binding protein, partial [Solirubrobacteraceae bacterium]